MREQLLEFLRDQISEGCALRESVRDRGGIDTISGAIQAFGEIIDWIEEFEEDCE